MIELDIQMFGGRGAKSGKTSKQKTVAKTTTKKVEENYYNNRNVDDFSNWYEDNLDFLADRFEEKYKAEPINPRTGREHSRWSPFIDSEYAREWKNSKKKK